MTLAHVALLAGSLAILALAVMLACERARRRSEIFARGGTKAMVVNHGEDLNA